MKDLSFYLFKNSMAAKMKKGFKSFCNGDGSTSTLNQRKTNQDHHDHFEFPILPDELLQCSNNNDNNLRLRQSSSPTLEEMIMKLELEEETARRRAKLYNFNEIKGRMSCVNNSDILRSARNALNQYPRFSLDGKDAMYRSSFRNMNGRKSVCCEYGLRKSRIINGNEFNLTLETALRLPATIGGESVVWRKPGVVGKLMGLDAMPMPMAVNCKSSKGNLNSSIIRRKNLRKRAKKRVGIDYCGSDENITGTIGTGRLSSCSSNNGYYVNVMKPVFARESGSAAWQTRGLL